MFYTPGPIFDNGDIKIHFLSFQHALLTAVRSARVRVWIIAYVINSNMSRQSDPITMLLNTLARHVSHGVDVRFIVDDPPINKPNYHCNKYFMRRLDDFKIPFITPSGKITSHAKVVLIDDTFLFIGSHNLTKSSLTNPLDCTVELRNRDLIKTFGDVFQLLWTDRSMTSHEIGSVKKYPYYG